MKLNILAIIYRTNMLGETQASNFKEYYTTQLNETRLDFVSLGEVL